MNSAENKDKDLAECISQRVVARATLRKISNLIKSWEEDDKQNIVIARIVLITFLWVLVFLLWLVPLFLNAFHAPINTQYIAGCILIGICGAIAIVFWGKRRKRNRNAKPSYKQDA